MELAKRRRDAELMRLDLQSSVARERAKEAAFIGTNAVLAELDTAVKALLLATGASNPAADGSAASAVNKFLSLGEHPLVDHVDLRTLQLEVDEWCSADAYSQAALSSAEAEMSEEIAKSLLERVRLLQQALNKLSKISALPAGAFETSCSALLKLAESEKFTLQVEIDRLKSAINDLGHRLFVAEKRRCKAEKDLDSLLIGVEVAATAHSSGGHPPIVPSVALGAAPAPTEAQRPSLIPLLPDEVPGTTGSNADVDAKIVSMKQEIALLEEQLAESEKLKDLAERKLNSSMLVLHEDNTSGTEILEILKKEFVHHISSLQSEVISCIIFIERLINSIFLKIAMLRTQLDASHASLAAIEQISSQKIKDLSAMTNAELARLSAALIEAESKLIVAESESRGLQSIKLQVIQVLTYSPACLI